MVLRIRLQRFGQKKVPFYHIVCCKARTGRQSKPLEKLGTYNPIPKDGIKDVNINFERAKYWIGVGAQPSDTCAKLLEKADLLKRPP
ncbi:30S ribosomal protein S16, partial [Protomyces lactucae-debilis]